MRKALVLALALAAPSSVFAQVETGEFFGMSAADMQAAIGQAKANEHREHLRAMGWKENSFAGIGRLIGTTKRLTSRQDCIIDAVIGRMKATIRPETQWPDVLKASETDEAAYRAAVKAQYPDNPAAAFSTIYLPDYNVIYLDDAASSYKGSATMDAALAGQYARFIDWTQKDVRDDYTMVADAAETEAWYRATYPAGTSSCRY